MRTLIIVQARMSSTRLPGKVLKTVLGKPLLEYQIERLQHVQNADDVVVATTINPADDPIVEFCQASQTQFYRGSEDDVLSRYYGAAQQFKADTVVRVTSDCPLIDPKVVEQVIRTYLQDFPSYDYVSNCLSRTYPRGMDTEVFSMQLLREIDQAATAQADREHVTPFIYHHPHSYKLGEVRYFDDQSHHRWTVDTTEDFMLVCQMLENLYPRLPNFSLEDCLELHRQNPEWVNINSEIKQKQYGEL